MGIFKHAARLLTFIIHKLFAIRKILA